MSVTRLGEVPLIYRLACERTEDTGGVSSGILRQRQRERQISGRCFLKQD